MTAFLVYLGGVLFLWLALFALACLRDNVITADAEET